VCLLSIHQVSLPWAELQEEIKGRAGDYQSDNRPKIPKDPRYERHTGAKGESSTAIVKLLSQRRKCAGVSRGTTTKPSPHWYFGRREIPIRPGWGPPVRYGD